MSSQVLDFNLRFSYSVFNETAPDEQNKAKQRRKKVMELPYCMACSSSYYITQYSIKHLNKIIASYGPYNDVLEFKI